MSNNLNAPTSLGRHFIVGLSGVELSDTERDLLKRLNPLGIILFRHNISQNDPAWPERLHQLIADAKATSGNDELLISIDHEGGRVHRLPAPATHFPAARNWDGQAFAVGSAMGQELRALGFNLNFAPVADIQTEEQNTVIGVRAFGNDADTVSDLSVQFLKGMKQHGVIGCAKHFPGHGDTVEDSHFALPSCGADRETICERELKPFSTLIRAGVPMVMTGHIVVPAFDTAYPATISKAIITDLLRKQLGFNGVVITDALEMRALQHLGVAEKALLAIAAGTDVLMLAQPYGNSPLEQALEMSEILRTRANEGDLTASAQRISGLLKYRRMITPQTDYPLSLLGSASNLALANSLSHSNVTTSGIA